MSKKIDTRLIGIEKLSGVGLRIVANMALKIIRDRYRKQCEIQTGIFLTNIDDLSFGMDKGKREELFHCSISLFNMYCRIAKVLSYEGESSGTSFVSFLLDSAIEQDTEQNLVLLQDAINTYKK